MPGVIIGHNQDIAWGMTNLGADVTDLYLEKVTGERLPVRRQGEALHHPRGDHQGRGRREPSTITVRETNNGPLVSDRSDELEKVGKKAPVDQRRARPRRRLRRRPALDRAGTRATPWTPSSSSTGPRTSTTFRKAAAEHFEVPSQNLIYADTKGNIGYQAPGKIPVRGRATARCRAPAGTPTYGWKKDYIPFDELPYEYNPKRGYIVTANQAVIDEDKYPYLLTKDWGYGTRSQRINDLIESKIKGGGKISTDDMQTDADGQQQRDRHAAGARADEDQRLRQERP